MSAAAAKIRASINVPRSSYAQAIVERTLDAARASLAADAFDTLWTGAQSTPWEQIVDEALSTGNEAPRL